MPTFCPTCGSTRYLVHVDGCTDWQIPVEMPAPTYRCVTCGASRSSDCGFCAACLAKREVEAQTPSPCCCQFCRDGGCRGNRWCHCRDGILYGQIEADNAKITTRKRRTRP
jgi:hypothetical protein